MNAKTRRQLVFAKWIAESSHNLDFVTNTGYLPVTTEGFEGLFENISTVQNEKYRMLYSAVNDQYNNGYTFCSIPLFENASDTQKNFEELIKSTFADAHEKYVSRTNNGENSDAVMSELMASALSSVQKALQ